MSEDLSKQIATQVEYYFSDVNLKRDSFFQKEMEKDDGFISVEVLLKCNKLKKLTQDSEVLVSSLAGSELIISDDKKKVKRKTAPPALDDDVAKRSKREPRGSKGGDVDGEALKKAIAEKAQKACKDRSVFKLTGLPKGLGWTEIKDAVKGAAELPGKIFIEHEQGATEAHVSCFVDEGTAEKLEAAADKGMSINETKFTMTKIEDEAALQEYWVAQFTKNPPKELERELKKAKNKRGKDDNPNKKRRAQSGPVTIAGAVYTSKDEAKTKAMEIAKRNPDSELEVLAGADREFAAAVLDFHPNASEKKKNLKDIAVGTNPDYPTTRCFFAVQEDGTKVDFSYIKCIDAAPEGEKAAGKRARSDDAQSPRKSPRSPKSPKKAKTE